MKQQDLHSRYRPLAGPFGPREIALALSIADRLRASGARVLTQDERRGDAHGPTIYRLRSECESCAETRQRLKRCSGGL